MYNLLVPTSIHFLKLCAPKYCNLLMPGWQLGKYINWLKYYSFSLQNALARVRNSIMPQRGADIPKCRSVGRNFQNATPREQRLKIEPLKK